jgi:glycosyltransferase involved in cell wall biosynthesis
METIGLAINSFNPNQEWLKQAIQSGLQFDEIHLFVDRETKEDFRFVPEHEAFFRLHNKKHLKSNDGFDFVARHAKTDWVCAFCDDDYFHEQNLGYLLNKIRIGEFADADIIHFKVFVNSESETWGAEGVTEEMLLTNNCIPHASFFRKRVWQEIGGYKVEPCADWSFWLRAMRRGFKFKYFDKPVYFFRMGHDSEFGRQVSKFGGMGKIREIVLESAQ